MKKIKIFAPASVANVSCGFDILGFPLENQGDILEAELNTKNKIEITEITGFAGNLSLEPKKNVCGVVAQAILDKLNSKQGISFKLNKGVLAGSGMGSSASSSAAAAYAVNEILGKPFTLKELVPFAMLGEKLASGTAHADNVAPALLGGFVLIRTYEPLDIINLPVPKELYCTVIHPKVELLTQMSRNVLKKKLRLETAVKQMGNVAGLVAGLFRSDYELIGNSLHDYIVEPMRSVLIPGFDVITHAAKQAGALGGGISGSGPSIFALCKSEKTAQNVAEKMVKTAENIKLPFEIYVSKIASEGCRTIDNY